MKYFPQTPEDIRAMLERIGVQNLDDLFAEIPEELKLKGELQIPHAQTEMEVRRTIGAMAAENRPLCCFAGGGVYDRYVPSMVGYLCQRSEFSTSYTPYQAEISQGTLQYIFEYQTMMARLTGMDVSNASMYDGATATAEAMMMCVASAKGKRHRVVVSQTLFPEVLDVVRTYADYHGVTLCEVGPDAHGLTCREAINAALDFVRNTGAAPVPLHLRNAPTTLMADLGYSDGYRYPHDFPHHFTPQQYMPDSLQGNRFWQPADNAQEDKLAERMRRLWGEA